MQVTSILEFLFLATVALSPYFLRHISKALQDLSEIMLLQKEKPLEMPLAFFAGDGCIGHSGGDVSRPGKPARLCAL